MRIYRVVWYEDGARHYNEFSTVIQAQEFVKLLQADMGSATSIVIERHEVPATQTKYAPPKPPERRSAWERLDDDAF